ncbi:threonine aldolase family protein [Sinorhizobium alkalisoli]|uniref:L-threonine aldolase n=1 Tax=Sinorhizobium alkalisoli TaxID=1752398 RepID=A0A1E3VCE6_9HYPH|nr:low specificity L-threonine aldolase [Sinorhizobium alkalisoli]MCA1492017.1 low specificity L-threonine aldolase [Ensifer sp. NBAIM29]ODR90546.1 threonine aldolase [Sinorhizobium alkalisoli]QFI67649.1 Low-specificity L-threonine aldolase [Sinorhizobium alkalisoli]
MIFASDNWAGAHPAIAHSLAAHAGGCVPAYGASELDLKVEQRFSEIFGREVAVFFVGTGTAANSLALATANRPGGVVFCHREAHVNVDECGAPAFFSHGARLNPVDGAFGKMDAARLEAEIRRFPPEFVHGGQPMAITIAQATESGTVYSLDEIEAIAAIARAHRLPLHMDGARFANALVGLDITPAEMTWKRGVDLLSFGGTKNGCWCAEAVVLFDLSKAPEMQFLRKQTAQLFSKSRFIAAQFDAYFAGDLWLDLARHANAMAKRLADGIAASASSRLAWTPAANEVFVIMKREMATRLQQEGAVFYDWHVPQHLAGILGENEGLYRLVTSFVTAPDDVDRFVAAC